MKNRKFIDKVKSLKINWFYILIIILLILIGIPLAINYLIINNEWYSKAGNDGWISFWGSYLGGIFGGIGTLIAVMSTKNQTNQVINQNSSLLFNQILMPKIEQVVDISQKLIEDIGKMKSTINLLKQLHEFNFIDEIIRDSIKDILKNISEISASISHNSNLLISYNMYVKTNFDYDVVKRINSKLIESAGMLNNIVKLVADIYIAKLNINNHQPLDINSTELFNCLDEINEELKKIIAVKNNEMKSIYKNILS